MLLIIDEVSMVGCNMLLEIHKRLQQIKGESDDAVFGGVSIQHRKNRPRSRYPFRRKTVSVITEYAGVRGSPLYIHHGLRADRGGTP